MRKLAQPSHPAKLPLWNQEPCLFINAFVGPCISVGSIHCKATSTPRTWSQNPPGKASKTHTGANTLQGDLFLLPSSISGIDRYYPSSSLPTSASTPAALVQDLANFTPGEEYLSPVPVFLVALKCLYAPIMAVFEQVQHRSHFSRMHFCLFAPQRGASDLKCLWACCQHVAVAQCNVPCSPAPCQQMPLLF